MSNGLSIGGYKGDNTGEPPMINLGKVEQPENVPVETPAPTQEVIKTEEVITPTAQEVVETPSETIESGVNAPDSKNSLPPTTEPETRTVQEHKEIKTEVTDEIALAYLSEKLGRQVNSFDEVNQVSENPLDKDPYLKGLYEWREKTGRDLNDWIKYQKDYSKLSDSDVAREFLQHEYPTLTKEEINLELNKFASDEYDSDSDRQMKSLELKKYATKGREQLTQFVSSFEQPVDGYIPPSMTDEIRQDLELAKAVKQQKEITLQNQQAYSKAIAETASNIDSFEMKLSDDLAINFKVSETSRADLPSMIETMPHWVNQDGTFNHKAVVQDGIKIKHFDEMIKLAYEQGVSSGKEALTKESNNITLGKSDTIGAHTQDGKKGVTIEDIDSYLGSKGMKIGRK